MVRNMCCLIYMSSKRHQHLLNPGKMMQTTRLLVGVNRYSG